jgi:hypothetical protein
MCIGDWHEAFSAKKVADLDLKLQRLLNSRAVFAAKHRFFFLIEPH